MSDIDKLIEEHQIARQFDGPGYPISGEEMVTLLDALVRLQQERATDDRLIAGLSEERDSWKRAAVAAEARGKELECGACREGQPMSDRDQLIEELRDWATDSQPSPIVLSLLRNAADALVRLRQERDGYQAANDYSLRRAEAAEARVKELECGACREGQPMSDRDQLIEELRDWATDSQPSPIVLSLLRNAADALVRLRQERDGYQAANDYSLRRAEAAEARVKELECGACREGQATVTLRDTTKGRYNEQ